MSRFSIAPDAAADIQQIVSYIATDSVPAALEWQTALLEIFHRLTKFPELGHRRRDLLGERPLLVCSHGKYLILYRARPGLIEIVAVLHGSRDIPVVLRQREESR